ncbi:MAG: putative toxin-antitoxin system toxin component, PIN family [Candidatus Aminicenantes bacterium]|nr:putative toxin-antitoxin system toxin component, PIN family [Candidatus Aminicenantes bacterium]
MKVVLVSNVIIAAFSGRGLCHSLFEMCIGSYNIIMSEHILHEVYRILHERFKMPVQKVEKITSYLREFCEVCFYEKLEENICRDKDDDEILALAQSENVDYIISGDKDLLVLEEFDSIPIVSPRDFWQIVRNGG